MKRLRSLLLNATPVSAVRRFRKLSGLVLQFALVGMVLGNGSNLWALTATTTTLSVTNLSGTAVTTVASGTAIQLVATVKAGGTALTAGTVYFCNALTVHCTDINRVGAAQLTSSGSASLRLVPGIGSHSYKAIFVATNSDASSSSAVSTLVVGSTHPTTVAISNSGSSGNYTLQASVTGTGAAAAPTGSISFLDQSNSNYTLATETLGTGSAQLSYTLSQGPAIGNMSYGQFAVGDFNGDGIPDVAVASYNTDNITILLGNGDGSFRLGSTISAGSSSLSVVAADFNGDGNLDLAVTDSLSFSVTIYLGKGDGTFTTGATLLLQPTTEPWSIVAGDFNGDGILDLAIADHETYYGGTVTVFLGNGDGTFTEKQIIMSVGDFPTSIAAGDFTGSGVLDLAVANSASGTVSILMGNGDGTFTLSSSISTEGSNPAWVVVGDFNGDGYLDFAVANIGSSNAAIFLGNGTGAFTLKQTVDVGASPRALAITDLNGDGIPDLAVANGGAASITLLLGNGDGTFTAAASTVATGVNPYSLASADWNGDGIPDLMTTSYTAVNPSILLGGWNTTVSATASGISPVGTGQHSVVASYPGDSNYSSSLSGIVGLTAEKASTALTLIANQTTSGVGQAASFTATLTPSSAQGDTANGETVTLFSGATSVGTGTLSGGVAIITTSMLASGTNSLSASYAGDTDFIASTSGTISYQVLPVTSTTLAVTPASPVTAGTVVTLTATVLTGATPVTTGTVNFCDAASTSCADIHLLGKAQLTSSGTATIRLRPGVRIYSYKAVFVGTNTYAESSSAVSWLSVTSGAATATSTTIQSSGSAGNYTLTTTVSGVSPRYSPTGIISFLDTSNSNQPVATATLAATTDVLSLPGPTNVSVGTTPGSIATGDFNNDGIPDAAIVNEAAGTVTLLQGNGDGSFTPLPNLTAGTTPYFAATGDFNSDGNLDLVVANYNSGTVSVFLGSGNGTFTLKSSPTTGSNPTAIAVGDFNGDGIPDLAVLNGNSSGVGTVSILLGAGDGTFTTATTLTAGTNSTAIVAGDFTGSGKLDLAVANVGSSAFGPGSLTIFLGNGDGTFTTASASPATGESPASLAIGDFNSDGIADMVVANSFTASLTILLGNGDGSFTPTASSPATEGYNFGVAVADFNGDDKADIATVNGATSGTAILLGNGDGTFQTAVNSSLASAQSRPVALAVADFNGDGVPDIGVANQNPIPLASSTYYASFYLTNWTETATATATGVSVVGSGTHLVEASYPGDGNFAASYSGTVGLTAQLDTTALALAASPLSTATLGQTVTLTATLSPASAQGETANGESITFYANGSSLGTATLSGGVATLSTTDIPAGSNTLTASYAGDANFAAIASGNLAYTVNTATNTTLNSSQNPSGYAQSVTITATVAQTSGSVVPTGTVQFSVNGSAVGSPVALNASGKATYTTSTFALGSTSVTATYTPTGYFLASSAAALSQVVDQASQTITFGALANQTTATPPFTVSATASSGLPVDFYATSSGAFSWGTEASLPTATFGVMAGAPGDGMIYVVGGTTAAAHQVSTLEQYNPITNTWATMTSKPTAVTQGAAAVMGGLLYVAGGWGAYLPSNVLEAYNPQTNSWSQLASMPHLSGCSVAGVISNQLYVFTPCNGYSGYYALLDVYNPTTNTWTSLPSGPNSHGSGAGGVLNGKLYVVGGYNSAGTVSSTLDVYSPSTGWSTLASMPVALAGMSADVINGQLYVVGGANGATTYSTVYVYDPSSNTWSQQTSLPNGLANEAVVAQNYMLYTFGGSNSGNSYLNSTEIMSHAAVCTSLDGTITITGVGTCTVTAYQPGNVDYAAAPPVAQSFTVTTPVTQLAFGASPATPIYVDGNAGSAITVLEENSSGNTVTTANDLITLTVTGPSGYMETYWATASAGVATFDLSGVSLGTAGSYLYTPTLTGTTNAPATEVVNLYTPDILFLVANQTFGNAPFPVTATSNSTGGFTYSVVSGPATISGSTVTLTGAGTVVLQASEAAAGIYAAATQNASFTVAQSTQAISSTQIPSPVTFGVTPITLSATATSGLTVSFSVQSGPATISGNTLTITGAGTVVVAENQAGNTNYLAAPQVTETVVVNKATPTITWATPANITYGTALSATQLNATTTVAGNFVYTPALGTVLTAGSQTLSVSFTPSDTADYNSQTATVQLVVLQATPTVTWNTPSAITYGTSLSATQLNATASTAGTFGYSPIAGTVLGAGSQRLTVTFMPSDPADYSQQVAVVYLTVNQASPIISWSAPGNIPYGTALSAAQLNATASVAGSFLYSPAIGTVLGAGTHTLSAIFTPTDSIDYNVETFSVSITVTKVTPTLTWSAPASIPYGTALSATQLDASASVPGNFVYTPASGTVLTAGSQTLSVSFTPTDTTDYASTTDAVSLTVNKATSTISWTAPAAILYGTLLSATQLDATASVPGSLVYTPASGALLTAGSQTLSVSFTPTDTTDYTSATDSVSLTVNKAVPVISWSKPAAILYGTALSSTQLDATASVPGALVYTPSAGTILGVGTQTLSASFTPTDTTDYTLQSDTVTLTVNQATPSINWATPAAITYGTALSSTQLDATSPVAGNFSYSPALGTVLGAGAETLTATFTPNDTADYTTASQTVSLTVNQASQTINFTAPASPITYGSASVALVATGGTSGNPVTFSVAGPATLSGNLLTFTGAGTVTVTANQAGNANYAAAAAVPEMIVVSKAAVTLSGPLTQPVPIAYGTSSLIPVSVTGQYAGAGIALPTGSASYTIAKASGTVIVTSTTTLNAGIAEIPVPNNLAPGSYTVSVSYIGDSNYNTSTTPLVVTLQIGLILPVIDWPLPGSIAYGTTLNGVLDAVATSASAAVPGSYVYTATPSGSVVADTTLLAAGSYTLGVSFTPNDPTTYQSATSSLPLTITRATPGITLIASSNPILVQNVLKLTATLSASYGQPTGVVSFYDGATLLGTGTVVAGTATFVTSTLAVGAHALTAVYNGDANFFDAVSASLSELVQDFSLSAASSEPTTVAIKLNQMATYNLLLTPLNGTTFPADIVMTVSGAPAGSIVTFTPAYLSAGSGATPFTMTVAIGYLEDSRLQNPIRRFAPLSLALLLLPWMGRARRRRSLLLRVIVLLFIGLGLTTGMSGCGYQETVNKSFTLTVTASSGSLSHSTALTLKVE